MIRSPRDRDLFLRSSREIDRVKRLGRRIQTPWFHIAFYPSDPPQATRVTVVVGRRFGIAVRRNRAKRIFRALARLVRWDLVQGWDLVIFPRRDVLCVSHADLKGTWSATLLRAGLLTAPKSEPCVVSA